MKIYKNNLTYSEDAYKEHKFYFDKYSYKLRLEYIMPNRQDGDLKWNFKMEPFSGSVSINRIGNLTKNTILTTLKTNLKNIYGVSNSNEFAEDVYQNILELTKRYEK